jgi:hypothetical protein
LRRPGRPESGGFRRPAVLVRRPDVIARCGRRGWLELCAFPDAPDRNAARAEGGFRARACGSPCSRNRRSTAAALRCG